MSFDEELMQQAVEIHEAMKEGVRFIAMDVFKRIVRRTPHDTGKMIANWKIGVDGDRAAGRVKETRRKKAIFSRASAESIALKQAQQALDSLSDPFTDIRIVNNQPYAGYVHYKDGGPTMQDLIELSLQEARHSEYQVTT